MSSVKSKLNYKILAIVLLSIGLLFTSTVLALSTIAVNNNIFKTDFINIKLGWVDKNKEAHYFDKDNKLINENEFLFEPGISVEKNFFIENKSSDSVFYKIYFDNVSGSLEDELVITVKDSNGDIYYKGTPRNFVNNSELKVAKDPLEPNNNRHYYTISFHYPEECGNRGQGQVLEFDFCAKAVQTRNNTNREFRYGE